MTVKQKGFSAIIPLLILVIIGIVGGTGWYIFQANKNTDKVLSDASKSTAAPSASKQKVAETKDDSVTKDDEKKYEEGKVANIRNFSVASDSLKSALIDKYYDDAKVYCDKENASLPAEMRLDFVIIVQKMVRDDFATVGFCGHGGSTILAHTKDEGWVKVAMTSMTPACTNIDKYKVSKIVAPACYPEGSQQVRTVEYP